MTARERLAQQIETHEAYRPHVYDDDTGRNIGPGTLVKGHPTVGIGLALDVDGLDLDEARWLLDRRLERRELAIREALPWFDGLDDVRQSVLIELSYNVGVRGLLEFKKMLSALMVMDWAWAVAELKHSKWAGQVQPDRVATLTRQMATGQW